MRAILIAVAMLAVPCLAHAKSHPSLYDSVQAPSYTCTPGDNSTALNGLLANGGTVNVAAGVCNLSQGLHLTVSGTTLNGAGAGQTIFQATTPLAFDVITVGLAALKYRGSGFTVSNLTTDGGVTMKAPNITKVGRGIVVLGGVTQSLVSNVETRFSTDGASISGSYITIQNQYSHDNRHAGIYGNGIGSLPAPYNVASQDTVTGGQYDNNCLDNVTGHTFDNMIFANGATNWTVGGPNEGDGNEASGNGDILISCLACGQDVGVFTVEGNTVNGGSLGGVRLTGNVHDIQVLNNMLINEPANAITVAGQVQRAMIQGNMMQVQNGAGVGFLSNAVSPGVSDSITISNNYILMANQNMATVAFQNASTNVTITGNAYNGAQDNTAMAGAGLVDTGNF